jgi:hypothetical protein
MTRRMIGCLAVAGLFLAGCGAEQQRQSEAAEAPAAEAAALPPMVAQAVAVARGIDANPAAADSILSANGLTAAGLDSLMYTIAADSALAAAYANAMR